MSFARALTVFWAVLVVGVLVLVLARPELFTPEAVVADLRTFGPWAFGVFAVVSLLRGLVMVPSTPIILAGGALFPAAPGPVIAVSLVGIVATAVVLHRFPRFGGFDTRLAARHPERMERIRGHLTRPTAQWAVAAWAFFPAVPTDLVCYTAGLVGMPLRRLVTGILLGEVPLVVAYVLLGKQAATWLAL